MTRTVTEPHWVGEGRDRRFGILVRPDSAPKRALLYIAPFAEEMNKSRHLVAAASRAMARQGCAVLSIDLFGCGDSPGLFEDASWPLWCDDIARAHAWLSRQTQVPVGLWTLRAGALLAAASLPTLGRVPEILMWQPVLSGKTHLTQFLRLKVAADAIGSTSGSTSTAQLWSALELGSGLDIAGYRLTPQLVVPMASVTVSTPPPTDRVTWLEVNASGEVPPASSRIVEEWNARGISTQCRALVGPPFWQTQELEECPALISATVEALAASHG